jgi:hypothetical protein
MKLQMLEILRDPLWQFIGAVIAVFALISGYIFYRRQRQVKRLVVETVTTVPLVAVAKEGIEGLRVLFNERPIKDAAIVMVDVFCSGNTPILAADFDIPLSFEFGDSALVLSADLSKAEPIDLPASIACHGSKATVSKLLLNPGDSFRVRFLVENAKGDVKATARIVGVSKIENARPISIFATFGAIIGGIIIITSVLFAPGLREDLTRDVRPGEWPYIFGFIVGFGLMIFSSGEQLRYLLRKFALIRNRPN